MRLALALPLAASLVATAACHTARTDVDDVLPDVSALTGEGYVGTTAATLAEQPAAHWWERFEDPVVDRLVEAVLAGNLDLQRAAASVREADARARSARGARGPAIDAFFTASRNLDNPPGGRTYSTVLVPQVVVSWQADLFGRLRAVERARVAELLATEADRLALAHTLVEEAVRFRVRISVLERRLALARDVVASRTGTLQIVEGRYDRGVTSTSAVDIHQARENLAAARTALPATERALEQSYLALDVLLGRKPGTGVDLESVAAPLPITEPPPAGLPAELLDRRPDLLAERLLLEAAAAEVDVSIAALYPDLVLSSSAGWSGDDLGDLFTADSLFADLVASLSAPLFASGRLRADVDAARARLEGLAVGYAAAVLRAVREVEDALVAERLLREELDERTLQRDEARRAEDLARVRYSRGLESLLTVLDTERRRASAEDEVLRLQGAVWNARIDLHLALGGDWFPEDTGGSR